MKFGFSMQNMLEIASNGFSVTWLTSSATQCKKVQFLVLFAILANLGWPGVGQILNFV